MSEFNIVQFRCYEIAKSKGWHDKEPICMNSGRISELLLLLHGEISEAAEDLRKNSDYNFVYSEPRSDVPSMEKPCGFKIELADLAIRLLDTCQLLGINLEQYIELKSKYNKLRPYRHGDKTF
jgi:NTP pyrophosphatase (non-canonical NTP hydrolase)